jgi:hypothetical protein
VEEEEEVVVVVLLLLGPKLSLRRPRGVAEGEKDEAEDEEEEDGV